MVAKDFTGFEAAHIFPFSETKLVGLSAALLLISVNPFEVERSGL